MSAMPPQALPRPMDAPDLVRYNHALRRAFADFFAKEVPWEVLMEDHETSHQNIANVFMHGCNMEDWWLHYVWPGKAWDGPAYDGFRSAEAMRQRVREVESKTEALLRALKPSDLQARKRLDLGQGQAEVSLEQVLLEAVFEDTHHRGEILAMLWRKDITPPYQGFLEWSRARR